MHSLPTETVCTQAHKGTRITPTNLTWSQPSKQQSTHNPCWSVVSTTAEKGRNRGRLNSRSPGAATCIAMDGGVADTACYHTVRYSTVQFSTIVQY
jgi:hypothetical protein